MQSAPEPSNEEDPAATANPTPENDAPIAEVKEAVVSVPEPLQTESIVAVVVEHVAPAPAAPSPAEQIDDAKKDEEFEILNWHTVDINKNHPEFSEFAVAPPANEEQVVEAPTSHVPATPAPAPIEAVHIGPEQQSTAPPKESEDDDMAILNWENVDISKNYPATGPVVSLKEVAAESKLGSMGSFGAPKKAPGFERASSKPILFSPAKPETTTDYEEGALEAVTTPVYVPLKDESKPSTKKESASKQSSKSNLAHQITSGMHCIIITI